MKIEAGRFYKTRDGRKVGPMKRPFSGVSEYAWVGDYAYTDSTKGGIWYRTEDGLMHPDAPNGGDIVAEWKDEPTGPVITETVKRIVPGVYGRVEVVEPPPNQALGSCVKIGLHYEGACVSELWVTPNELRAAAATLTEIADALDGAK